MRYRYVLALFCDMATNSNPGLTQFRQLLDGLNLEQLQTAQGEASADEVQGHTAGLPSRAACTPCPFVPRLPSPPARTQVECA